MDLYRGRVRDAAQMGYNTDKEETHKQPFDVLPMEAVAVGEETVYQAVEGN